MIKKFTRKRQLILDIIRDNECPVSAEDILNMTDTKLNLSTVYRALEFLEENGLIKSISFDGKVRFFFGADGHHHFLYCDKCHGIQTFDHCAAEKLQGKIQKEFEYEIKDHVFYFTGICNKCKE